MIETHRVLLRKMNIEDVEALAGILGDDRTMEFWQQPFTVEQVHSWIHRSIESYAQYEFGRWLVVHKQTQQVIGDCGILKAEINGESENDLGYIIHHPWWRQGYAYEAANVCVRHAFSQLKLDRLAASMACDHKGSIAVAEKLGMKKEGQFSNPRNRNKPTFIYGLNNDRTR